MDEMLGRYWWVVLLRGIAAIAFGLLTIAWPGVSLLAMTVMFGAMAFVDGVASLVGATHWRKRDDRWYGHLLMGLASIGFGVFALVAPGMTTILLLVVIGFWSIATGLLGIAMAFRLRDEMQGELWLAVAGLLSVIFGMFVLMRPGEGALSVAWLIGGYAFAAGVVLVVVAFRVRSFGRRAIAA